MKRKSITANTPITSAAKPKPMPPPLPAPPPGPPPPTYYRRFLNSLIGKSPANLTAADVNSWRDINFKDDREKIVEEIAQKFNNRGALGINKVSYTPTIGESNYFMDSPPVASGAPPAPGVPHINLTLGEKGKAGPNPLVVGHELLHANDHQVDGLNSRVWGNLSDLAQGVTPTTPNNPMDAAKFFKSVNNIQRKLDPDSQVFPRQYDSKDQINRANNNSAYDLKINPMPKLGKTGWPSFFSNIQRFVSSPPPPGGVPNQEFTYPFASEFPAFMMENLTRPWKANETVPQTRDRYGSPALNPDEARFLHKTLGNMSDAYPAATYPTMNGYIQQRRNSLENAYYPPVAGGVPSAGFAKGGRVKSVKYKKRGLSNYL